MVVGKSSVVVVGKVPLGSAYRWLRLLMLQLLVRHSWVRSYSLARFLLTRQKSRDRFEGLSFAYLSLPKLKTYFDFL